MSCSYYVLPSPRKHVSCFLVKVFVDAFTGGLVLYFWLIVEGEVVMAVVMQRLSFCSEVRQFVSSGIYVINA